MDQAEIKKLRESNLKLEENVKNLNINHQPLELQISILNKVFILYIFLNISFKN